MVRVLDRVVLALLGKKRICAKLSFKIAAAVKLGIPRGMWYLLGACNDANVFHGFVCTYFIFSYHK